MSGPSTPDNPYPIGLRLSESDIDLLETAIIVIGKAAESQGRHDLISKALDMRMRIKQCMVHGSGLTQEHRDALQFHVQRATKEFQEGNMTPEALQRRLKSTFSQFLSSAIRLDPDPAHYIADFIVVSLQEHKNSLAKDLVSSVFADFKQTLEDLRQNYAQDGWPSGEEIMTYLLEAVSHEMQRGSNQDPSAPS